MYLFRQHLLSVLPRRGRLSWANFGVGKCCWWQKYWHVAVEETLGALNDLVKAGKVLYLGGTTKRSSGADMDRTLALYRGENDFKIAQRVVETAEKYGKTPAQIALAPDDIDYLKELYRPLDNLLSLGMS